jgi:predicted RNase H-like HicB family nuclease
MRADYHINAFYSEEDEAYIADIPDFEMCSAFGDTPEEALAQVLVAKEAMIQVMRQKGLAIPEPKYRHILDFPSPCKGRG